MINRLIEGEFKSDVVTGFGKQDGVIIEPLTLVGIGDIDIDESMPTYPEFSVMTNLSCPKCFAEVEVLKKRDAYD